VCRHSKELQASLMKKSYGLVRLSE